MVKSKKCKLKPGQKPRFQKQLDGPRRPLIIENLQNCFFHKRFNGIYE